MNGNVKYPRGGGKLLLLPRAPFPRTPMNISQKKSISFRQYENLSRGKTDVAVIVWTWRLDLWCMS